MFLEWKYIYNIYIYIYIYIYMYKAIGICSYNIIESKFKLNFVFIKNVLKLIYIIVIYIY